MLNTGIPWRDLPERYGPWKSVYARFRRWSQQGVWEHIIEELIAQDIMDEAMAVKRNEISGYGWFLRPLLLGGYSEILTEYYKENGLMLEIRNNGFETE